jgi:NAD(P)H-dependent FMN reductase
MIDRLRIGVIVSSVRQGRRGEGIARWFAAIAAEHEGIEPVLLDLKDFLLPDYAEPTGARMAEASYAGDAQRRWVHAVTPLDGFVIVTPEYNHGYPAPLKNALDHVFSAWRGKPVSFVSYGGISGGTRCVQQLRQVAIELQLAPLRDEVNIPLVYESLDDKGAPRDPYYAARARAMLDALLWWGRALAEARAKTPVPSPPHIPPPKRAV